jgi:dTDP-4-amino-4,6-dideoxygalactose transaminase
MAIKFLDLGAQNREIADRVAGEFAAIHAATSYVGGPAVAAFERDFAGYLGVENVVGVGSGTDALRLALLALGIGPGDGVITVPMTFIATAEAIVQTGAVPEFVDVDPRTCNMSPEALLRYLEAGRFKSPNGPRAIVPVDLYGLPCAIDRIMQIARRFRLVVVEDACQARGAAHRSRVGQSGHAGRRRLLQLLPGQEPGRLGRSGRGGARRQSCGGTDCALTRPRTPVPLQS